jgi:adenylate kinase family enzyme
MKRISIIGTTGSGKTTLAAELARTLGSVHIELDALNWQPGWKAVPTDVFRRDVLTALEAPEWVTEGNYHSVRDIVWERADCIVWLNYRLWLILTRLIRRTATRVVTAEECCNGNRESLRMTFSRDSILLWALKTHNRHHREYPMMLSRCAEQRKTVVIHRAPHETRAWLEELRAARSLCRS